MKLTDLQKQVLCGWNTWYSESVTTHVLLPWGFAVRLNFRKTSGDTLRNLLISRDNTVKVDVRNFDGSYTCLHLRHGYTQIKVESAAQNDELVLMISPMGAYDPCEQVLVETCFLWGRNGTLTKENGVLGAICPDGKKITLYTTSTEAEEYLPEQYLPYKIFTFDAPIVFSTYPLSVKNAYETMKNARQRVLSEIESYGDHAESFCAMQNVLGWNTIYDPIKNRICTPVSRNWNVGQGSTLFVWDTLFASEMLASGGQKEFAYANVKALLDEAMPNGMLPNVNTRKNKSFDRSQPLVGSMTVKRIYQKYEDVEFLSEVYPALLRWNTWYTENRMTEEGYICCGSKLPQGYCAAAGEAVNDAFAAKCESGMDNSPIYDDIAFDKEKGLLLLADVGQTGLYIKDCRTLMEFAEILGRTEDIAVLQTRLSRAENALLTLWNEEAGIYENRDLASGELSSRHAPTNFYCLFSQKVTAEQKRLMMEKHLFNPDEFWGDYVLPAIARSDVAYPEQIYWRGRIWAPLNAIVYEALKDAGLMWEARMLALKSEELLLLEWRKHRHVHENYFATDGFACDRRQSDAFYHWGALLGYIVIDSEKIEGL